MKSTIQTHLISAPAGTLEVMSAWQQDESDTLALVCHPHPLYGGSMTNKVVTTVARQCIARGMHTVCFNFRCVGQSTGEHDNGFGELDDAKTALVWALKHLADNSSTIKRLYLAGFSFGGFITAKLASDINSQADQELTQSLQNIKISQVKLIAPAVCDIDDRSYDVSNLQLPTKQTHVIYGSSDEVVPPEAIAKFATDYKLTQVVLHDAVHFFHGRLTELREFI